MHSVPAQKADCMKADHQMPSIRPNVRLL